MIQKRVWTDDSQFELLQKLNEMEQDLAKLNAAIIQQQKEIDELKAVAPTPLKQIQMRNKVLRG